MRLMLLLFVLVVSGGILIAALVISNRTLASAELATVRTVCASCHGQVPQYDFASRVHDKHATFQCGFCHRDNSDLKTADSWHQGLEWLGIGTALFALTVIIANAVIINRKVGVN